MTEVEQIMSGIKQALDQATQTSLFDYNVVCSVDDATANVDVFFTPATPVQWIDVRTFISPEGPMRLKWRKLEGKKRTLECSLHYEHNPEVFTPTGLRDEHLDPVLVWCRDNNCGYRTSYNHFAFDTDKQMTLFLLRWA